MNVDITIGWTRSDRASGYSSLSDGYRPGAAQHTETIAINLPDASDGFLGSIEPGNIAEYAFEATNAPQVVMNSVAWQIREALAARGFDGSQAGHYSVSVGDTVIIGEIMLACTPNGWARVSAMSV